ncbi:MAG: hypothetical protein AAGI37_02625 [Planctomycetota bacterium]
MSGAAQPWINLDGGPLAPRHQWRRIQPDRKAARPTSGRGLLAGTARPGHPNQPQRRLQAKLKQLRGESGLAGGDALDASSAPTLVLLHDLLEALPSDQRYAITDLRIEQGELRMTGYERTHGEADQIANTMRGSSLFVVEPPSTDNLREGGVRFALQATHRPPPPGSPENPEEQEQPVKPRPEEPSTKPPSLADRTQQGGGR